MRKYIFVFLLFILFVFSGCGENESPLPIDNPNKEIEIIESIDIDEIVEYIFGGIDCDNVTSDIDLPNEYKGQEITYCIGNDSLIDYNGKINRGFEDAFVEIIVKSKEQEETVKLHIPSYPTIELSDISKTNGYFRIQGVINYIYKNAIYIFDENYETFSFLYDDSMSLSIGDDITIRLKKDLEINVISVDINSSNNPIYSFEVNDLIKANELMNLKLDLKNLYVVAVKDNGNIMVENSGIIKEICIDGNAEKLKTVLNTLSSIKPGYNISLYNVFYSDVIYLYQESNISFVLPEKIMLSDLDLYDKYFQVIGMVIASYDDFILIQDRETIIVSYSDSFNLDIGDVCIFYAKKVLNDGFYYLDVLSYEFSNEIVEIKKINNNSYLNYELFNKTDEIHDLYLDKTVAVGNVSNDYYIIDGVNDYLINIKYSLFNKELLSYYEGQISKIEGYIIGYNNGVIDFFLTDFVPIESEDIAPYYIEIIDYNNNINIGSLNYIEFLTFPEKNSNVFSFVSEDESVIIADGFGTYRGISFGKTKIDVFCYDVFMFSLEEEIEVSFKDCDYVLQWLLGYSSLYKPLGYEMNLVFKHENFNIEVAVDNDILKYDDGVLRFVGVGKTNVSIVLDNKYELLLPVESVKYINNSELSQYNFVYDTISVSPKIIYGDFTPYEVSKLLYDNFVIKGEPIIIYPKTEGFFGSDQSILQQYRDVVSSFSFAFPFYASVFVNSEEILCKIHDNDYISKTDFNNHDEFLDVSEKARKTINDQKGEHNNIRSELTRDYYLNHSKKRSVDFNDFPIYSCNNGEISVYSSAELYSVVTSGWLPIFQLENTQAEFIFESAKNVLRDIIFDDMSDYQKVIAIYEWLFENVDYDYDAFYVLDDDYNNKTSSFSGTAHQYSEGVFLKNRAVCAGIARTFALMCRIEGIKAFYASGFPEDGVGHAWNYVLINNNLYLVDPTWGDNSYYYCFNDGPHDFGHKVYIRDYDCIKTYLSNDFLFVYSIDKCYGSEYDYIIDSDSELLFIKEKIRLFDFDHRKGMYLYDVRDYRGSDTDKYRNILPYIFDNQEIGYGNRRIYVDDK